MSARLTTAELLQLRRAMAGKAPQPSPQIDRENTAKSTKAVVEGSVVERISRMTFQNKYSLPVRDDDVLENEKGASRLHIAICLVIVDKLHHEDIWKTWVSESNPSEDAKTIFTANLYIHAKFPDKITSPWVRERVLDHSFLPEWNSVEVVCAMISVLQKALEEKSAVRFVFGTGIISLFCFIFNLF